MKLDAGQAIAPVPWPIQSNPMASARKPRIKSSLRMDSHSLCRPADIRASWKLARPAARNFDRIQSRSTRQGGTVRHRRLWIAMALRRLRPGSADRADVDSVRRCGPQQLVIDDQLRRSGARAGWLEGLGGPRHRQCDPHTIERRKAELRPRQRVEVM